MSAPTMAQAALAYARAGWPLVPLRPGEKRPLVATGHDHAGAATCDLARVAAWWRRWPAAGVGIVCAAGGFVVVDVDGEQGRAAFLAHPGPIPATCCSASGREGYGAHWWYRLPPGEPVPRGRVLAPGLELKAAGCLVVAPPSVHPSGRRYAWDVPPPFVADGRYPVAPQPPAPWMLRAPERPAAEPATPAPAALGEAEATPEGARRLRGILRAVEEARPGERHAPHRSGARVASPGDRAPPSMRRGRRGRRWVPWEARSRLLPTLPSAC